MTISTAGENTVASLREAARAMGLTKEGLFDSSECTLELAYSPDADLDGKFVAMCLVTGELLSVCGWLFTSEAL